MFLGAEMLHLLLKMLTARGSNINSVGLNYGQC